MPRRHRLWELAHDVCCRSNVSCSRPARKIVPLPIRPGERTVIAECIEPLISLSAIQKGLIGIDKSPARTRRGPILGQVRRCDEIVSFTGIHSRRIDNFV